MITTATRLCNSLTPRVPFTFHTVHSETVFIQVEVSINTYKNKILCHNYIQQVLQQEQLNWVSKYWQWLGGPELPMYFNFKFTELHTTVNGLSTHINYKQISCSAIPEIHLQGSADTPSRFLVFWKQPSDTEHLPHIYSFIHKQVSAPNHHDRVIQPMLPQSWALIQRVFDCNTRSDLHAG